eukprot:354536-Chlamydomonas_euryale.AAC.1
MIVWRVSAWRLIVWGLSGRRRREAAGTAAGSTKRVRGKGSGTTRGVGTYLPHQNARVQFIPRTELPPPAEQLPPPLAHARCPLPLGRLAAVLP